MYQSFILIFWVAKEAKWYILKKFCSTASILDYCILIPNVNYLNSRFLILYTVLYLCMHCIWDWSDTYQESKYHSYDKHNSKLFKNILGIFWPKKSKYRYSAHRKINDFFLKNGRIFGSTLLLLWGLTIAFERITSYNISLHSCIRFVRVCKYFMREMRCV